MQKFGIKEVFSDDWRQAAFWLSVASATLIVGFSFGWAWRDRPVTLSTVRVLDVLTAIGTIGAVVVALGSSWFVQRKESRVKMREGKIVAAQLSTSLPPLIRRLKKAVDCFREARDGPYGRAHDGPWRISALVKEGYEHLSDLDLLLHLPELGALAWADEEAAHLIAKAIGSVRHIQAHPLGEMTMDEAIAGLPAHRYYRVARHATNAAAWLEEARGKCSKLSKVKYKVQDEWRMPEQNICGYVPDED
ncbi:hypothetical protein [Achromobacter piechaudii]|uniref:hypothetical protein n=1 Tax=Achromobacter piechaudii TaxID=72556 RepID=UPI003DA96ECA